MSHLLDMTGNRANMAFVGETPWHGLGSQLPADASIDQWRVAAGLDWQIRRAVARFETESGESLPVDDRRVLYRSDSEAPLAIVSDRYKVVQPADILEFFRDLVADGGMRIDTAGSLDGGRKLWALATTGATFAVGRVDVVKPYVLLMTSCDGSSATRALFTAIRVVCNNTIRMALSAGTGDGVSVKHSTTFNAQRVKAELGLMDSRADAFHASADTLAMKGFDDRKAVNYFAELYVKRDAKGEITNEKTLEKTVNHLMHLYKRGPGAELMTAHGTAWGALNAVTRYVDFDAPARNDNNRFSASQFGTGATMKTDALAAALAA